MANIKNLALFDKKRLRKMESFVESELNLSIFSLFPIDIIHSFIPFGLKFLDESYVALEKNEAKGLITINKIGDKKMKIKRLLLDENSFEMGKLLVNYVVQIYTGMGSEFFYVVADKTNIPLITMFKNGCGFVEYSKEVVYKINKEISPEDDFSFSHIRKMKYSDIPLIKEIADNLIGGHKKQFFSKSINEFRRLFIQSKDKYVIMNEGNNVIGYFTINKLNNSDYILDFIITIGCEGYVSDIINYAKFEMHKKNNFKNLFFKLKSYYLNFKSLSEILDIEYEKIQENDVLIKDFYITQRQEFKFEKMIFNDITPAF